MWGLGRLHYGLALADLLEGRCLLLNLIASFQRHRLDLHLLERDGEALVLQRRLGLFGGRLRNRARFLPLKSEALELVIVEAAVLLGEVEVALFVIVEVDRALCAP